MRYFQKIHTHAELKREYKKLAKLWHPDLNPDKPDALRTMQEINSQYADLAAILAGTGETSRAAEAHANGKTVKSDEFNLNEIVAEMRVIILSILNISPDLDVEITGLWVWVSGDTKPHKDALKNLGLRWASKKKKWYFAGVPSSGRGQWSMSDIRARYGSAKITEEKKAIPA